ncbi:GNAT family N-acetyltransferase [Marinagarivorans cellulosilyticus]|uniref:N-acetyltransferase domain-containing protein n=1 Tax=Marinagarivorans cellulosilyticus TaxID=2721545 RepID=A0AAN2BL12_9GAMM|nr:GNAT family N-acetyltransferase [Marinagarivorans cellulosilyticus]BCD98643.1 hypothetical protein MARGE09_P2844 [Marinagarivorans cellulosilyticus]
MGINYEIYSKENITDEIRHVFAELLKLQGKVQGDLLGKADRCNLLCVTKDNSKVIAIGAIKIKTASVFSNRKSGLPELANDFEWELGYMYTIPQEARKGIAKKVAQMLVETFGKGNLMASTEVTDNPAMVSILEQLGFQRRGKSWKSNIHGNELGLFLKYGIA